MTDDAGLVKTPSPSKPPLKSYFWRRLRWTISLGLILALLAHRYVDYFLLHPMGSGPAGPTVAKSDFAKKWTDRDVLLLGFGDSVAAGYGTKDPAHRLLDRLEKNPKDEFADMQGNALSNVIPNLKSLNVALSGSTSLEHVTILDSKIPVQPKSTFGIVVLTTGGNDIIHQYGRTPPREGAMYGASLEEARPWIANFETRLDEMLDRISAKFPGGCEIFIANIYDPTDGDGDAENAGLPKWPGGLAVHAAYNQVIEKVVAEKKNVHLVDMYQLFLGHGIHCRKFWHRHYDAADPFYWYYDNLEDPNVRGFDALRRAYLIEMAKVLPAKLANSSP